MLGAFGKDLKLDDGHVVLLRIHRHHDPADLGWVVVPDVDHLHVQLVCCRVIFEVCNQPCRLGPADFHSVAHPVAFHESGELFHYSDLDFLFRCHCVL